MTLEQLIGKYMRLRAELSAAYAALAWNTRHIDRLDDDIESTGRAITQAQPLDEQTNDSFPDFTISAQERPADDRTPFDTGLIHEDRLASR